jgi:dynein light intermediate chain 1
MQRSQTEIPASAAAGIVGPLGSSSFSLPNVERALSEMESGMVASGAGANARLGASRPTSAVIGMGGRPANLSTLGPASPATTRSPVSPSANPGQSPGGQSQHEVLQNFFQSLLSTKDRTANGPRGAASNATKTNGTSANGIVEEGS